MRGSKKMLVKNLEDLLRRKNSFFIRTERYRRLGYNRIAAAEFVVWAWTRRLPGPALDVGTGKGLMALALARRELKVVSVDTDADEQTLAFLLAADAGLEENIRFVCGDASVLSYPDGHFGCAVLMDILHHLEEPLPLLKETARLLKPSGVLILADFSAEGFEIIERVFEEDGREHVVSGVTLKSTEAFLSQMGFQLTSRLSGHKHEVLVFIKIPGANHDTDRT
jgi:ubiquinone/menaquinone biosynthesis C-methylase UbiE